MNAADNLATVTDDAIMDLQAIALRLVQGCDRCWATAKIEDVVSDLKAAIEAYEEESDD